MKKIKIMLLSFALLAVVGGALAFKAKFNEKFCYTTTTGAGAAQTCGTTIIEAVKTTNIQSGQLPLSYTTSAQFLDGYGLTCYTWRDASETSTTTLTCPTSYFILPD